MWKTSSMIAAALTLACREGSTGPDQAACVRGALAQGAIVTGELSSADCTMTRAGVSLPYEVYTVRLSPGERYLITLHSNAAWTPILELRDTTPNHSVVAAGWSDVFVENRYSQLMFVAPNEFPSTTKTYELWVQGDTSTAVGRYTLSSQLCGGSSEEIWGTRTVVAHGVLSASDCVLHDRHMLPDSTYAHLFVLYLGRGEQKTITVTATSAGLGPSLLLYGPGFARGGVTHRASALGDTSTTSLTIEAAASIDAAGDYIFAVGGSAFGQTGGYTMTISEGRPTP